MLTRPLRKDNEYNEYVKDFYKKIEDYDWNFVVDHNIGIESYFHKLRRRQTLKYIQSHAIDGRFLDVGCGTGLLLRELPIGSVGVDINPRNCERARKYVSTSEVLLADAEELPFAEDSYANVICTEVLEHVVFPEKVISEIYRVLKPNGIFIGSTPNKSLIWRMRFLSSTHFHNEPFHTEFLKRDLVQLFQQWDTLLLKQKLAFSSHFFILQKRL